MEITAKKKQTHAKRTISIGKEPPLNGDTIDTRYFRPRNSILTWIYLSRRERALAGRYCPHARSQNIISFLRWYV